MAVGPIIDNPVKLDTPENIAKAIENYADPLINRRAKEAQVDLDPYFHFGGNKAVLQILEDRYLAEGWGSVTFGRSTPDRYNPDMFFWMTLTQP